MKILQINAIYEEFSTGRIVKEFHEDLMHMGIESYVAISKTPYLNEYLFKIGNSLDIKLHSLLSRIFGKQAYFSHRATRHLLRSISNISPDIVHLHNLHNNYINLKMLLKYLAKNNIATVITLHDCWFFTGRCTCFTATGCYRWQIGCGECPRRKMDNPSWFFDRSKKMWNDKKRLFNSIPRLGVIGVSDWITNEAKKSFLKDAKQIKRIYNWIDLDDFKPKTDNIFERYNVPTDKFTIIMVGAGWTVNHPKYNDLINLSKLISEDMQIILLGGCNGEVPDNVIKVGYIKDVDELASFYSASDVYVHVSREDTFGKVVAEAIACGTPAIVYNTTALPELVPEGCGYVVENENVEQIYEKIQKIRKNGKDSYSDACVKYTQQNFERSKLVDETISFYKELIGVTE